LLLAPTCSSSSIVVVVVVVVVVAINHEGKVTILWNQPVRTVRTTHNTLRAGDADLRF